MQKLVLLRIECTFCLLFGRVQTLTVTTSSVCLNITKIAMNSTKSYRIHEFFEASISNFKDTVFLKSNLLDSPNRQSKHTIRRTYRNKTIQKEFEKKCNEKVLWNSDSEETNQEVDKTVKKNKSCLKQPWEKWK